MSEKEAATEAAVIQATVVDIPTELMHAGVAGRIKNWIQEEGPWWLCSFVFHVVLVCSLALVSGKVVEKIVDEAPSFDEAQLDKPVEVPKEIERFEVAETPEDPTELSTDTLSLEKPAQIAREEKSYDDSATFREAGGGMASKTNQPNLGGLAGFDIKGLAPGPAVGGKGAVGVAVGTGAHPGSGGDNWGFSGRGAGQRKAMLGSGGGTRQSERAVAGALNWMARHQLRDGSWNLTGYKARCKDPSCSGEVKVGERPAAATAFALLPFFAAGLTHETKGPYKRTIYAGIAYLVKNQKKDGDLRMGGAMYDHGLASIALCECYGMTGDKVVGAHAQAALNFIMQAQDPAGGGWRYEPRQPGDTSVVGWQIMALKSGVMAYLAVNPAVFEKAKAFLKSVSAGKPGNFGFGGTFGYMEPKPTAPLTAVGLLCCQYMGMPRTDPAMIEGTAMLMRSQPDTASRNLYYWYYATQVMHNQPGPDWDVWNRKMRRTLIDTQCKEGNCAAGSWDLGDAGGRVMSTSLAALTLEVYYRYLPLYKLDSESGTAAAPAVKPAAAKPAADAPANKAAGKSNAKPAPKDTGKNGVKPAKEAAK
jgi:hypothetical protein